MGSSYLSAWAECCGKLLWARSLRAKLAAARRGAEVVGCCAGKKQLWLEQRTAAPGAAAAVASGQAAGPSRRGGKRKAGPDSEQADGTAQKRAAAGRALAAGCITRMPKEGLVLVDSSDEDEDFA